jgi:hypothetical protein
MLGPESATQEQRKETASTKNTKDFPSKTFSPYHSQNCGFGTPILVTTGRGIDRIPTLANLSNAVSPFAPSKKASAEYWGFKKRSMWIQFALPSEITKDPKSFLVISWLLICITPLITEINTRPVPRTISLPWTCLFIGVHIGHGCFRMTIDFVTRCSCGCFPRSREYSGAVRSSTAIEAPDILQVFGHK